MIREISRGHALGCFCRTFLVSTCVSGSTKLMETNSSLFMCVTVSGAERHKKAEATPSSSRTNRTS